MLKNKNHTANCNPSLLRSETIPSIPMIGNAQIDNTDKDSWMAGKIIPGIIQRFFSCFKEEEKKWRKKYIRI